jgi:hypothetical protein
MHISCNNHESFCVLEIEPRTRDCMHTKISSWPMHVFARALITNVNRFLREHSCSHVGKAILRTDVTSRAPTSFLGHNQMKKWLSFVSFPLRSSFLMTLISILGRPICVARKWLWREPTCRVACHKSPFPIVSRCPHQNKHCRGPASGCVCRTRFEACRLFPFLPFPLLSFDFVP